MKIAAASLEKQTENALSVGQLNLHIKRLLEADPILEDVAVSGEISNFKLHSSGHAYFSLKDDKAQIRCILWKSNAHKLRFRPADGDHVIVYGHVDFYGARGETSLIVDSLHFAGAGALLEKLERLRAALAAEGLFDASRKKPLPLRPIRIGLVTSATGAAPRDVLSVLERRWPLATVVLIPALVQGFDAPQDIIRAMSWAQALEDLEVVIVARGGGSTEDLWCFNDETLVRYAAEYPLPFVSAVGHEVDFTLLDFVADVRAATPTAAGEIVAPDINELRGEIAEKCYKMQRALEGRVLLARQRWQHLSQSRALRQPQTRVEGEREVLARLQKQLQSGALQRMQNARQKLERYDSQLAALDPQRVLERGYALLQLPSGGVLSSASQAKNGDELEATLHDGKLKVKVL